jgi:hypothetical protein
MPSGLFWGNHLCYENRLHETHKHCVWEKWNILNVYIGFSYIYHDAAEVNE